MYAGTSKRRRDFLSGLGKCPFGWYFCLSTVCARSFLGEGETGVNNGWMERVVLAQCVHALPAMNNNNNNTLGFCGLNG